MRYLSMIIFLAAFAMPATSFAGVDEGDTPSFEVETLDGETLSAAELRGKVVLVDFWAMWCAPCKKSFPFYSKLVDEHGGKFVVVPVSIDPDAEDMRSFVAEHDYSLRFAWDEGHALAKQFGPSTFPTAYLIDATGKVRHIHEGFNDEIAAQTRAHVTTLVGQIE